MLIHAFAGEILERVQDRAAARGARGASSTPSWRSDLAEVDAA